MPAQEKEKDNFNKYITIFLAITIIASAIVYLFVNFSNTNLEANIIEHSDNEIVLTMIYEEESQSFTMEQLLGIESITAYGGYRTQKPSISGAGNWTGVPIITLVNYFNNVSENYSLEINTSDGETKIFSYETANGYVDIYDAENASNGEPLGKENLTMIAAYKFEGNYLNESKDGKLRIAFVGEEYSITSAGLWWKFVNSIEIIAN
jgi:hypothetical protein